MFNPNPLEEYHDRVSEGQGTTVLEDQLASALHKARLAIDNAYDGIIDYYSGDAQDSTLAEIVVELATERSSRDEKP